mmetsp:Transcript_3102/g.7441  ORF Transcript_3102/g.7441 Transcript_3102/m.7441 type:complete len:267 (+) Transcript_3102:247-1047(+)
MDAETEMLSELSETEGQMEIETVDTAGVQPRAVKETDPVGASLIDDEDETEIFGGAMPSDGEAMEEDTMSPTAGAVAEDESNLEDDDPFAVSPAAQPDDLEGTDPLVEGDDEAIQDDGVAPAAADSSLGGDGEAADADGATERPAGVGTSLDRLLGTTPAAAAPVGATAAPEAVEEESSGSISFPLSRIRAIMKLDPETGKMGADAVYLVARSTELFVQYIADKAHQITQENRRKTIQKKDILTTVQPASNLEFLESNFTEGIAEE